MVKCLIRLINPVSWPIFHFQFAGKPENPTDNLDSARTPMAEHYSVDGKAINPGMFRRL
jgi:hypothetical protein